MSDAVLHRLEALPGEGRFAVTFRRPDGSEQTAVAELAAPPDGPVQVAAASLPTDWTTDGDAWHAAADAVRAFVRSRAASAPRGGSLRDVDGGWDVGLGNVVLGADGVPTCTSHGPMVAAGEQWTCAECGAAALYG